MNKKLRAVRIAGKDYSLSASGSSEHIDRMVHLVNEKLREAAVVSPQIDRETAAIAVALSLTDELIKTQDDNTRLRRELSEAHEDAAHED